MFQKRFAAFAVISGFFALVAFLLIHFPILEDLDNKLWDWRLASLADGVEPDPEIKIIMIDQESINHYATKENLTWPWPRSLYVPVLEYLRRANARGVAFDMVYTEASVWGVSEDEEFADGIRGKLPVVTAVILGDKEREADTSRMQLFRSYQDALDREGSFRSLYLSHSSVHTFRSATLPVEQLLKASHAFGNVSASSDSDGVFRHYETGGIVENIPVLSLPFALFHATGGGGYASGDLERLTDTVGRLSVVFSGPEKTYPQYRFQAVVDSFRLLEEGKEPLIPLSVFRNARVFIGSNAGGLLDLRPTPLSRRFPGVEYHATVLDNLIHKRFVKRASNLADSAYAIGFVLLASGLALLLQRIRIQLVALIVSTCLFVVCGWLLAYQGIRIEMITGLVCMIGATITSLAMQYYLEGGQHRFIKKAFSQYLSPEVVEEISKHPDLLKLGGERKDLTVFFSDIEGFTSISETLAPSKLSAMLNRYLSAMTDIILESGGTLDKYIGDAIVAFWNAPLSISDHQRRGVQAALDCQTAIDELRCEFEEEFGIVLNARIGVHTGPVVVGNFGSTARFNYTILGDSANLASRLEGVNKIFGTSIIISGDTMQETTEHIYCRKVAAVRVVGKKEVVHIFEPLGDLETGELVSGYLETFERSMEAFEDGRLVESLEGFMKVGRDKVARRYVSRITADLKRFTDEQIEAGEFPEWSPIWNIREK